MSTYSINPPDPASLHPTTYPYNKKPLAPNPLAPGPQDIPYVGFSPGGDPASVRPAFIAGQSAETNGAGHRIRATQSGAIRAFSPHARSNALGGYILPPAVERAEGEVPSGGTSIAPVPGDLGRY